MNNKTMLLTGTAAIFVFFIAIAWWILAPAWILLFPHPLSELSQQHVLLLLNQHNVEYKLDSAKNTILVKSSELQKAQVMLAENGQPEEQSSGLEVFNSSDYGLSEFAQNINYQRGMEEELARTIKKLQGIKSARVHLTIKKDSLFDDRKQLPKATVVIKPLTDEAVSPRSVRGIQEIVAAAVPNLEPQKVTLVTDTGQVLSSASLEETKDVPGLEEKYTRQISYLLNGIFNSDDYKISVNVAMDYKKKVTVEENYFPNKSTGTGFLAKRKSVERSGSESTLGEVSKSTRDDEEEYLFSKEHSEIVYSTGEIKKIAVGIVINKTLTENERLNIEKLIFSSLGMVETRGDKISIFITNKPDQNSVLLATDNISLQQAPKVLLSDVDAFLIANKILIIVFLSILLLVILLMFILYKRARSTTERTAIINDVEVKQLSDELKEWLNKQ